MRRWMICAGALALMMGLQPDGHVFAQTETAPAYVDEDADGIDDRERMRHRGDRRGFLGRGPRPALDETQRTELKNLVDGLREGDATREEIRDAVDAKLAEWGIERPDPAERPLDETQRTELKNLVDGLREGDATREEIRDAVDAKLAEWGIERPDPAERPDGRPHAALSEAQRDEIRTLVDGLREGDATREEIRDAVDARLDEWGIQRPERSGHRAGPRDFGRHGNGRRGDFRGFRGPGHHESPAAEPEKSDSPDSQ